MCFAVSLRKESNEIEERLTTLIPAKFEIPLEHEMYYHLNGFTHGNLQIIKMDEPNSIYPANWGLVPNWAMDDIEGFWKNTNTLNARSESIFEKASFRDSAESKRCLIIADGFYEPHYINKLSHPYFCYQPSIEHPEGDIFLFAGLYTEIDEKLYTATIITAEANDFFAEIHNVKKRMPLVLYKDLFEDWLDDGLPTQAVNELMAFGFTREEFKAHPVSRDLYKKNINTNLPYIVEPIDKGTLF